MIVVPRDEYITRNVTVEPVTAGGIPKLSKTGLKMTPPPSPKAPAIHPPIRDIANNLLVIVNENLRSLLQIPLLYLILKNYSCFTLLYALNVIPKQATTKTRHMPKSYHSHFSYPSDTKRDGLDFEPLIKLVVSYIENAARHIKCLSHYF